MGAVFECGGDALPSGPGGGVGACWHGRAPWDPAAGGLAGCVDPAPSIACCGRSLARRGRDLLSQHFGFDLCLPLLDFDVAAGFVFCCAT